LIFIDYSAPRLYGHPVRIIEGEAGVFLMRSVPIFLQTQEEEG
jgi:hypothetical protein